MEARHLWRVPLSLTQSLPRVGKVASEASRIGQWRYEIERERSSQVDDIREHPIHRCAVPLPRVGKVASGASRIGFWRYERERGRSSQVDDIREHPSASQKESQPRLAALGSPFQGKGLAWTLPPSYGRRCPEGAEVGWGKRDEKEREDRLKSTIYESTLSTAARSTFPAWGRWRAKRAG